MTQMISLVTITLSLPAFFSGVVAGLVASRAPRTRRAILIGFAALACSAAWFLYDRVAPHCDTFGDVPLDARCAGLPSWKDALGAFLGADVAIFFQAVVTTLFAAIARKYPLRRMDAN